MLNSTFCGKLFRKYSGTCTSLHFVNEMEFPEVKRVVFSKWILSNVKVFEGLLLLTLIMALRGSEPVLHLIVTPSFPAMVKLPVKLNPAGLHSMWVLAYFPMMWIWSSPVSRMRIRSIDLHGLLMWEPQSPLWLPWDPTNHSLELSAPGIRYRKEDLIDLNCFGFQKGCVGERRYGISITRYLWLACPCKECLFRQHAKQGVTWEKNTKGLRSWKKRKTLNSPKKNHKFCDTVLDQRGADKGQSHNHYSQVKLSTSLGIKLRYVSVHLQALSPWWRILSGNIKSQKSWYHTS